jgi:hypothetical protein
LLIRRQRQMCIRDRCQPTTTRNAEHLELFYYVKS